MNSIFNLIPSPSQAIQGEIFSRSVGNKPDPIWSDMQMVQRTFSDDEETNIDAVAIIQGGYDGGLVPDYICFRYDKVPGNLAVIRISAWQRSYCAKIARILTSCGFAKITVMRNAIQYTDPSRNSCDFLKMIKQMSNRPIILLMNRSCFGS